MTRAAAVVRRDRDCLSSIDATAYRRVLRAEYRAQGLCACGARPAAGGLVQCEVCAERGRTRQSKRPRAVGCRRCGSREHATKRHDAPLRLVELRAKNRIRDPLGIARSSFLVNETLSYRQKKGGTP